MSKVKTLLIREAHKIFNFGNVQKILKRKKDFQNKTFKC